MILSSGKLAPQSAQRLDQAPKLDSRLTSGTVPVIAIPLAFRRAAACAVHSADLPASDRRRATGLVFFLVVKTKRFETGLRRGFC